MPSSRLALAVAAMPFGSAAPRFAPAFVQLQPLQQQTSLPKSSLKNLRGHLPAAPSEGPEGLSPSVFPSSLGGGSAAALVLCSFLACVASRRRNLHRQRTGMARRIGKRDPGGTGQSEQQELAVPQAGVSRSIASNFDDVESAVVDFVPKIAALQNQADELRKGELQEVIQKMKQLRETELRGVFGEVDQLLCALVDAIHGLRDGAMNIRKSELRQQVERIDEDAQAWVGRLEQNTVSHMTGFPIKKDGITTMMEVHVIGLSHHSAPVETREKLAVPQPQWNEYANELVEYATTGNGKLIPEVAVLSTCNRFELYFATPELKQPAGLQAVLKFLEHKSGMTRAQLEPFLFQKSGAEATRHLFEVSSGLDSLVVGEGQILSQTKACYVHCIQKQDPENGVEFAGKGGKVIAKLMNAAIRMGKTVRTDTKISKGAVSVSSAAAELVFKRCKTDVYKPEASLKVCVVGAGKMSRLLLIHILSKHPQSKILLVNRSVANAQSLIDNVTKGKQCNCEAVPLENMWEAIDKSDVAFLATSAKEPIITAEALQKREQIGDAGNLMLVDICVPRNVATDCAEVAGVHSYDVDDLKKVVQANTESRMTEIIKAKEMIGKSIVDYRVWQCSQGAVPYLVSLQKFAENIRQNEKGRVSKMLKKLNKKESEAVEKLTQGIIRQLLFPLYQSVKAKEGAQEKRNKILALKNLFQLEPEYKSLPESPKANSLPA